MRQQIVDTTFGFDPKLQAVLSILATKEPNFATFDDASQMYEISFRTGIQYEEGLEPQVWIAMFPQQVPEGECIVLSVGVDISGQVKISLWGYIAELFQKRQPDFQSMEGGEVLLFKEVSKAVDFIEGMFKQTYLEATFEFPNPTRLSML